MKQDLIEAVKAHALAHYEDGGWDILVECYDDAEIAEVIGAARTPAGAIAKAAEVLGAVADYRAEVIATAF